MGFMRLLILLTSLVIFQCQSSAAQENKPGASTQSPNEHAAFDLNNAPALDMAELVREIETNGAVMHMQMRQYTYLLKKTRRVLNQQGKVAEAQVQAFEAYPVRGEHVLIQLTTNGVPLPSWQVEAERKRAGERLEKLEREEKQNEQDKKQPTQAYAIAGVYGRAQGKPVALAIDPAAFLHSCELSSPRFERVGDRDMIVLNFRSRPGVNLPKNKSFVARLAGSIWIDAVDKVITRLEGRPAHTSPDSEARLIYQQVRLPGGVWFPNLIRVNAAGDYLLFDGLNWDVVFEFSDYKRFSTSVEEVNIQDPRKRP
jgi:hypothetical protein